MNPFDFDDSILKLEAAAMADIRPLFNGIDATAASNTKKVMTAFAANRVSETLFAGSTGYGHDDRGRAVLDALYAQIFGAEAGLARINLVSGTHAITAALFGALRPGDTLLYMTGAPYDTLQGVIGITGSYHGSMKFYGINYRQADMTPAGTPDYDAIRAVLRDKTVKVAAIQRSRGYSARNSLPVREIERLCAHVKALRPDVTVFVDNCYGEFVEEREPTQVGVDLCAGSLIKNPGGGLAPCGGYIVGRRALVENAAMRMTAPGIGGDGGATLGMNRLLYQGLFLASHTVAQALKTAVFCARLLSSLGYRADPSWDAARTDIIQRIEFGSERDLSRFCAGIQMGAPVDAFVTPEFAKMPGYDCPVIMAAGSFIQGASIELSADGPKRPPYAAYMQGGLTFESGRLGILAAVREIKRAEA